MIGRRGAALVVGALLVVAGCQGPGTRTPTRPASSPTPSVAALAPVVTAPPGPAPAAASPATPTAAGTAPPTAASPTAADAAPAPATKPAGPGATPPAGAGAATPSPGAPSSAATAAAAVLAGTPTGTTPGPAGTPSAPTSTRPAGTAATTPPATPPAPTSTAAPAKPTSVPPTPTTPPAPPKPATAFNPQRVALSLERVGAGFVEPLFLTHDPNGRLYVLEKVGRIKTLDGALFLDITDRVTSPPLRSYEREQGLLGLAFHPRFAENGYFYVHYNGPRGHHVFSRFTVRDGRADPASEKVLLTQEQPETNFNGGMITFGRDGYLYMGLGTGGTAVRLQDLAQNLGSLLGKILRIDVDRGDPYAVPPDNPFVGRGGGARGEVWAYGVRNPYRFSFDRATGDLYIASPGQFTREWISFQPGGTPGGRNFGWPVLEGSLCWNAPTCDRRGLEPAILEYPTYEGGNCAVIGGYVYRGRRSPLLDGVYLFGDFCGGRIYAGVRGSSGAWTRHELARVGGLISSFGEDQGGEVYVTDISNGIVYRLVATPRG